MTAFSARICDEVLAEFPEWKTYANEESWNDSPRYFVFMIPTPAAADAPWPLRISTWDDEVTIDFDHYHAHFDRWLPEPGDSRCESALLYVRDLLAERVAVASWWQGTHFKLSAQVEPNATKLLTPSLKIAYTRVRVRSWAGTHNAEVMCTASVD